jgi:hypothetical protein
MEETRITSSVANLDVEIVRKDYPEDNAEVMTIRLQASPSFEAVGRSLMAPFASPLLFGPFAVWARMMQAAWTPMLAVMTPQVRAAQRPDTPRVTGPANRSQPGAQAGGA